MLLPIRFDMFPCVRFDTLYTLLQRLHVPPLLSSVGLKKFQTELFISTVAGTYAVHLDRTTSSSHSNPMAIWTERRERHVGRTVH